MNDFMPNQTPSEDGETTSVAETVKNFFKKNKKIIIGGGAVSGAGCVGRSTEQVWGHPEQGVGRFKCPHHADKENEMAVDIPTTWLRREVGQASVTASRSATSTSHSGVQSLEVRN
ncbi:hypothetical protein ACWEQ3_47495 [Streptomyces mirabilis]